MTIYSGRIRYCGHTDIWVGLREDGRCTTVIGIDLCLSGRGALFFPVPAAEDSEIEFLELGSCGSFFSEIDRCFKGESSGGGAHTSIPVKRHYLVREPEEFQHADADVRPDSHLMNAMPMYWNWPFAVAELEADNYMEGCVLVGHTYTPARENELFFPLVIAGDGSANPMADFDHTLCFQQDGNFGLVRGWDVARHRPGAAANMDQLAGVVHPGWPVQKLVLYGNLPNCDYVLQSSRFVEAEVRSPFDLEHAGGAGRKLWELLPDEEDRPETAENGIEDAKEG